MGYFSELSAEIEENNKLNPIAEQDCYFTAVFNGEIKCASSAQLAGHADLSAHELHQFTANGEAQATAGQCGQSLVGQLCEGRKDLLLVLRTYPRTSVGDLEAKLAAAVAGGCNRPNVHPALGGELQRITHQVHQHLLQAQRIAELPVRNIVGDFEPQADIEKTPGLGAGHVFARETMKGGQAKQGLIQDADGVTRELGAEWLSRNTSYGDTPIDVETEQESRGIQTPTDSTDSPTRRSEQSARASAVADVRRSNAELLETRGACARSLQVRGYTVRAVETAQRIKSSAPRGHTLRVKASWRCLI